MNIKSDRIKQCLTNLLRHLISPTPVVAHNVLGSQWHRHNKCVNTRRCPSPAMSTRSAQLLKATDVEYNHPIPIRLLIVGAAFLTYLIDRDDIVWRFIKNHGAQTRTLEHWLFLAATLLVGMGAYVCTAARIGVMCGASSGRQLLASSSQSRRSWGEFLYAVGLASLAPLSGYCLLVLGEAFRLLRLSLRNNDAPQLRRTELNWPHAIRSETAKWGIFITMLVFTITLKDRYAEALVCTSVVAWGLPNWRRLFSQIADQ